MLHLGQPNPVVEILILLQITKLVSCRSKTDKMLYGEMDMKKKGINTTYVISVLVIILVITLPMLIYAKQEDKKQFESFLNEFYSKLDNTLDSVDYLLSSVDSDISDRLIELDHKLETTNLLLHIGSRSVDSRINDQPRFFIGRIIQNQHNSGLTDEQKSELEKLQRGLKYMKDGLYSQKTGQEIKISVKEFNQIIEEGARIGE